MVHCDITVQLLKAFSDQSCPSLQSGKDYKGRGGWARLPPVNDFVNLY